MLNVCFGWQTAPNLVTEVTWHSWGLWDQSQSLLPLTHAVCLEGETSGWWQKHIIKQEYQIIIKKHAIFFLPEKTPSDSSRSEYARSIRSAGRLSPRVRVGCFQRPAALGSGRSGLVVFWHHLWTRGAMSTMAWLIRQEKDLALQDEVGLSLWVAGESFPGIRLEW